MARTDNPTIATADLHAEALNVGVALITAPTSGVFHPAAGDLALRGPGAGDAIDLETLRVGDEIGTLLRSGERFPVLSRFTGLLMGLLALPGERVRMHQPLAWVATDRGEPS